MQRKGSCGPAQVIDRPSPFMPRARESPPTKTSQKNRVSKLDPRVEIKKGGRIVSPRFAKSRPASEESRGRMEVCRESGTGNDGYKQGKAARAADIAKRRQCPVT